MKKKLKALENHFVICGFGDIGNSICSVLYDADIPFVVIEVNEEVADFAIERQFLTVKGKATYDDTLLQAGIERAQGVVICLGDDSVNMHVSLAARELNPDIFIVTRGYKSHIEKRMVRAGANRVVNPLKLGGEQIANHIIKQYKKVSNVDAPLVNKSEIMGYSLKVYQHFQESPISIAEVKQRILGTQVLKLRKVDGSEEKNPLDSVMIKNHETALVLVDAGEQFADEKSTNIPKQVFVEWTDEYRVHIADIDQEHQKLFSLTNDFVAAINQGAGKELLSNMFEGLIDNVSAHCVSEEELFQQYMYPDFERHIEKHEALIKEMTAINDNETFTFDDNIADLLNTLLHDHILQEDMQYSEFLREKGCV